MCAGAAVLLLVVTRGWAPPLTHREGDVPTRDIVARTQFEKLDEEATRAAQERARSEAIAVYEQDPAPIEQRRAQLESEVNQLVAATNYADIEALWSRYKPTLAAGTPEPSTEDRQLQWTKFREALLKPNALEAWRTALKESLQNAIQSGVIEKLPPEHDANQGKIAVRVVGKPKVETIVNVSDVLREFAREQVRASLAKTVEPDVANPTFNWLRDNLPETLKLNAEATKAVQETEVAAVKPVVTTYRPGEVLARVHSPDDPKDPNAAKTRLAIGPEQMNLIRLEYQAELAQRPALANVGRSAAVMGMYVALYVLCGFFIYHREPRIIGDLKRLAILLSITVVAVTLMLVTSHDEWRAELIPLMLFGMTVAIAYQQEIALLLSAAVTLIAVIALGQGLGDAVVLMATTASAILMLGRIRSRSKLLTVGFVAAGVALMTTLGVGTLEGEPVRTLFSSALFLGLWSIIAGSLMTVLLPFVERLFGVQTDLSLIELGDPAHPLLQELIRRAPGTYNHSITVASLAEAAAESIGSRGLLVRVGAYFHDIGKMLKPGYFIENQGQGDNRHRTLVPAMSTLVIIAHVKDGADLARQNRIPEPIIDFIQQHHGTTLVEFFYRQASDSKKNDPNGGEVDESSFRYPGPKPQTKEAGILMMADAVESASRVLVEPTPSRIESLVEDISRKRLLDGQFDECGLTLEEVRRVCDSLAKSLTAVYHGRVKYPEQNTA
jgi:putative nucleotidyltransferase with HDIG domain